MYFSKNESRDYRNDTIMSGGLRLGRRNDTVNDTVMLGGLRSGGQSVYSQQPDNYRSMSMGGGLRANVSSTRPKVIQRRPKRTTPEQIANDLDTLEYLRGLTDRNGDEEREYKRLYNVCATRKSRAKNMT